MLATRVRLAVGETANRYKSARPARITEAALSSVCWLEVGKHPRSSDPPARLEKDAPDGDDKAAGSDGRKVTAPADECLMTGSSHSFWPPAFAETVWHIQLPRYRSFGHVRPAQP